jgi:toxin secretion/phage lysis holin
MMTMKELSWKGVIGALVAIGARIWGAWDQLMAALVILMVLDVVTGFLRAFIQQKLSSKESFYGIIKKVLIFCMLAVAVQVDALTGLDGWARTAVGAFYCASEGLSVIENSVAAGIPAPQFLKDALRQLSEEKFSGHADQ